MKILVITNLYPPHEIGGYELRCRDACDRLKARGHEIQILTSDHHIEDRPAIPEPHVARKLRIHGMYGNPWLPVHRLYALEKHNHQVLAHRRCASKHLAASVASHVRAQSLQHMVHK